MTDVFESWRDNRFIIASPDLVYDNDPVVILTDVEFWANHMDELTDWCDSTQGVRHEGMTLVFDHATSLTLFLLRWS
jgi:hypothetical protein